MLRRLLCILIIVVLCMSFATFAFAGAVVSFEYNGNDQYPVRWSMNTSSVGTTWRVYYWGEFNLSTSHKATVKIYHAVNDPASHSFYYSSKSTNYHPYTAYANGGSVYMAGCRKSGSTNVIVSGDFEP